MKTCVWRLPSEVMNQLLERNQERLAAGETPERNAEIWKDELREAIKLHGIPAPFGKPEQRELTL